MRKIVVLSVVTHDGVIQARSGPKEDPLDGFKHGGWSVGYWDEFLENVMKRQMGRTFYMLLGRKTYDLFASTWPKIDPKSIIHKLKSM